MNAAKLEALLVELLLESGRDAVGLEDLGAVVPYAEAGFMTRDRGLILEFDRSEFQITIVQTAFDDEEEL
jgi:hypothetical protein